MSVKGRGTQATRDDEDDRVGEGLRDEYRGQRFSQVLSENLRSLGVAQVATRLAGFAVVILLARELGRADFGRYTVALGVAAILALGVQLGMGFHLVREGARAPETLGRLLGHVLILRVGLGGVAVLVAFGYGLLSGFDRATLIVLAALVLAKVLTVVASSYESVLLALERAREAAIVKTGTDVGVSAAAVVAILLGFRMVGVALAVLAASVVTIPWARRRLRRQWSDRTSLQRGGLRTTLAVSAVFAASQGLYTSCTYLDSIMVHGFLGNAETGLYGAAYRVLLGLTVVPIIYVDATTRMISKLASTDRERMTEVYARALAHLSMFGLACGIGGSILSGQILEVLYGPSYARAEGALSILMLSAVFVIPMWITAATAFALGLEYRVAAVWGIALAGNGLANVFVIPAFGIEGAAGATLAAESFGMVAMSLLLRRVGVRVDSLATFGKPVLAGAIMVVVIWPLRDLVLVLPIVTGAIVFLLSLLALGAIGPEDKALIRALAKRGA